MTAARMQWTVFRAALDPMVGSEQAGSRPVLVVSAEALNEALPIIVVLPLTSARRGRRLYSGEVLLPRGVAGLAGDSIVMAHQIRTISKRRLQDAYGRLDDAELRDAVRAALGVVLDLEV